MSLPLVSRSPDLQQLVAEGYELSIVSDHLVVGHVPFVNQSGEVEYGQLICELIDNGGRTGRPDPHTAHFTGVPHDARGNRLDKVINSVGEFTIAPGLSAKSYLSSKPAVGYYDDYHAKVVQYVKGISGHAAAVDSTATAKTFRAMPLPETDSVFEYLDSASSRAGISELSNRLAAPIAIIGLGGTGAYVLDFVAKTHATEIHLWDGDVFSAHNAFRTPGAASADEINACPLKVDYLANTYRAMRRGIVSHPVYVDESNIHELASMSFVFITMDTGPAKKLIIAKLVELGIPFVDTGMGVKKQRDALAGIIRVTTGTPGHTDHLDSHISYSDEQDDEYDRNIQVADLNAVNAGYAVMKWKKFMNFYLDLEHEQQTTLTISGNHVANSEQLQ